MPNKDNVIKQNITETLKKNYMPYAMSVIVSRAIPEIDGFKPSHRKLLYTMYLMGLLKNRRIKSADVVGQTMKLNPHGDGAIYETLVRLTRGNDALLHPFIDSKGNFGKQTSRDMSYAASRYTEVKLEKICEEVFKDIDKNTVDLVDNYNGQMKEPVLFPTSFPNVLVTSNLGIAVGMASNICSFNLREICNATIAFMKNENIDLKEYIEAPDFSTGGQLIYNEEIFEQIYNTGRGSFKVRGKYRFDKKNNIIEIYEIPYTTTIEAIIDKIISLVKLNKIREVNDVRDETDRNGLKITIDLKRGVEPDVLMNKLFAQTPLEDSFGCNFNILIDGKPMVLGIKPILDYWIKFRISCIHRKFLFEIEKKSAYLHLLKGLSKIILDIDRAIKIIRETETDKEVISNLMKSFEIDEIQANYVAEIKLRNINKEYLLKKIKETDDLEKEIENLKKIADNEKEIKKVIEKELKEISKKYGADRRTEVIRETALEVFEEEDYIEDFPLKLFFTQENYFKKISLASLRGASEQNLKEDDCILQEIDATNKSEILFFSNQQNVYKMKCYEISDCKASQLGEYLINSLQLGVGEEIIYVIATTDYEGNIIFGFDNGKIAKIPLKSYATKINRKKLVKGFTDKAKCVFMDFIPSDDDYVFIRDSDRALLFSSSLVNLKVTRNTVGVQVFNLKKGSVISKLMRKEDFAADDIEYYRSRKIPSAGHFLTDTDIKQNDF